MRNRTWLFIAIVFAVAGLVLFFLLRHYWPEGGISPYNYRQIRLGMTAQEVEHLIGLPPGIHRTRQPIGGMTSSGNWGNTVSEEGIPEIELPDRWHGLTRTGQKVAIVQWWGTYHAIRIAVDDDGKIVGKYLFEIPWL